MGKWQEAARDPQHFWKEWLVYTATAVFKGQDSLIRLRGAYQGLAWLHTTEFEALLEHAREIS